ARARGSEDQRPSLVLTTLSRCIVEWADPPLETGAASALLGRSRCLFTLSALGPICLHAGTYCPTCGNRHPYPPALAIDAACWPASVPHCCVYCLHRFLHAGNLSCDADSMIFQLL